MTWWIPLATTAAQIAYGAYQAGQSRDENRQVNSDNTAYQKEFAQHGVQWRAADARAAGIAPEVAMGASTHQYQSQVGTSDPGQGLDLSGVNQAAQMHADAQEKNSPASKELAELGLQKARADVEHSRLLNLKLLSEVNRKDGSGTSDINKLINKAGPIEGTYPDIAFSNTTSGGLAMTASDQFAQRTEDDLARKIVHGIRNFFSPPTYGATKLDTHSAPEGYHYERNWYGDYSLVPNEKTTVGDVRRAIRNRHYQGRR